MMNNLCQISTHDLVEFARLKMKQIQPSPVPMGIDERIQLLNSSGTEEINLEHLGFSTVLSELKIRGLTKI